MKMPVLLKVTLIVGLMLRAFFPAPASIKHTYPLISDQNLSEYQDSLSFQIIPPPTSDWHKINEGETRTFKVVIDQPTSAQYWYYVLDGDLYGATIDSSGNFSWTPSFDLVDRIEEERTIPLTIEVKNDDDQQARKTIDFTIKHTNRPPKVGDLKNFYVQANVENRYHIDLNLVTDPDNDPLIFKSIPSLMPEGASLTENGIFTWKPSIRQFNRLKSTPINMSFIVEDQPSNAQVKGFFNILVTQMDLPPEITMVPSVKQIEAKENETINFKFFLSDPNGDEDIERFDVISEDLRINEKQLIKNATTQWEFIWTPGYDFVRDGMESLSVDLTFYVVDKTYLRDELKVNIRIINTENQEQIDKTYYAQYRSTLIRIWDLMVQLEQKEKELYARLKKARKGKTRLAITDASLGAITALSPFVIEDQKSKQMVSGIGGTTVMTMGTLEAASVIAKSPNEFIQNLNKVIEKKNELLLHGNVFARRYSTVLSRREKDFQKDSENLLSRLLLKDVATLELDAGWKNTKKPSDQALKNAFPDYVEDNNL